MFLQRFLRLLLVPVLFMATLSTATLDAKEMTQDQRNEMAAKLIPIITMLLMDDGDRVAPVRPTLVDTPPAETMDDNVEVNIHGEVRSKILVNGTYIATIGNDGNASIPLHMINGVNVFSIVLEDASGNKSEVLSFSITKLDVKIAVDNGTMQKIPFNFIATVENLPDNLNVEWYIDGNSTQGTSYSFDKEGVYYATAKITNVNNELVKILHTDIVAYKTNLVSSFTATASNDSNKYVYSDANSTLSGVSLEIPKESLLQDTLIELKESKAPNIPNLGRAAISKVLTLDPSGLEFEEPILVSMPYTGDVKRENIMIARYSEGGVVDTILPYSIDEENKLVSFKTKHFTSFSLQKGYNLIADPIYDQTVIQNIMTATGIGEISTNEEWDKILNTVLVEKGDYRVYDMWLEYDKQLRMSEKIDAGKYSEAIKVIFPKSRSVLEKEVETMKSLISILKVADVALHFDVREISKGGLSMASQIFSATASLLGLPTSVPSLVNYDEFNFTPKPLDTLAKGVDELFYSTLWGDLRDEMNQAKGNEASVMSFDVMTDAALATPIEEGKIANMDMMHNLKLIFLKNIHFKQHKDTYLQNLITTIRYYHEAKEKSVIVRPFNNHATHFVSSAIAQFRPEFRATPSGYSEGSFLSKNPRVTLSHNGSPRGVVKFKEKDEKGFYYTTDGIASFANVGDYVLDWKYQDDTGVEKNGKYYAKFKGPMPTTITDYKLTSNHISNDNGFIEVMPIFSTSGRFIKFNVALKIGDTTLTNSSSTRGMAFINIPNYADVLAGKLGEDKLNELKSAEIEFTSPSSSEYTFEAKVFTVDLLENALNGDMSVFDSITVGHYLPGLNDVPYGSVLGGGNVVIVGFGTSDTVPVAIDYENDGIYDKALNASNMEQDNSVKVRTEYTKKGVYTPCIKFRHTATNLEKRICHDYGITIKGDVDPVAEDDLIPEFVASKTNIVKGNVVTFTLDLSNVDTSKTATYDLGGDVVLFSENEFEYTFRVQYRSKGVFFPSINVELFDGAKYTIKSKPIKVDVEDTTGTITNNGTTYGTVTSPYTGKVWLDRNLGASQVCTAYNDTACYGDYYQWGRNFDGHQDSTSATTTTQATDVNDAGSSFILGEQIGNYGSDWAGQIDPNGNMRIDNWSKIDGTSVCPVGFRVPSIDELNDELTLVSNRVEAYNNFLKLPSAGVRGGANMFGLGTLGGLRTITSTEFDSYVYMFSDDYAGAFGVYMSRDTGRSVRCIKD